MGTVSGDEIRTIAVVGAGVIGCSWASYFAAHGYDVVVTDPAPGARATLDETVATQWEALECVGLAPGASPQRIRFEASLERAVADVRFVQENGPERLDVKHAIFAALDRFAPPDAILATSTSGLLVSDIQTACERPERVVLGHPFNPTHLIPLVEVVGGGRTSADTIARTMAFYRAIGKRPIAIRGEIPGHVTNRLQAALWREAFSLVERGIATVEDIDTAIEYGPGLRWALLGPFMNLALSGGVGGMRHNIEHLGPPMVAWWRDLGTPTLDDALAEKIVAGANAELASLGDRAAVEKRRDERLVALLALKAATPCERSP